MKIGKPKYGGEFVPTKYWKLKDGESTYRILPPLGDLADPGIWSLFYRIHYGYRNTEGRMRVFQSSLVMSRKNKGMIDVPDAAVERIERLKAELEKAKTSGNRMLVEKFKNLLQTYNLDSNHYLNAMDTQGNIGVLKLRHRAKQALDATIKKLNASGVDPLSAEDGRFITFTRSGTGLDTTFQVSVAQEELEVPGVGKVKRDLVHRITPEIEGRLGQEARELNKLFRKLTAEEIELIVKESDLETGRSSGVDKIFDTKGPSDDDFAGDDGGGQAAGSGGGGGATSVNGTTGTVFNGSPGTVFIGTSGNGIIGTRFETTTFTTPSATPPPAEAASVTTEQIEAAAAPAPSVQTTAQRVSNMSEEEFQKYISSLGI